MTELRVNLPDDAVRRLTARAQAEETTPEQLASEAVLSFLADGQPPVAGALGFIGIGSSGRTDISERAEEILRAELGT